MNWRSGLSIAAALLVGAIWLSADPPASPSPVSAKAAATGPAAIAEHIKTIRNTENPRKAMAAYAAGCSIGRADVALQEAYMRRMLRFGKPRIANHAARALLMGGDNPLAWAVVGYNEAKRKRLAKALVANVMAAEKLTDNPSVMGNLGQLIAWREAQDKPPILPDAAKRKLDRIQANLDRSEPFTKARRRIQRAYAARETIRKEHEVNISKVEAQAETIRTDGKGIDREIAAANDEIASLRRQITSARSEVLHLEDHPDKDPTWRRRRALYDQITDLQKQVTKLEGEAAALRRRGQLLLAKLRAKQSEIKSLRRKMSLALRKAPIEFTWDPPAVDGVVTPETFRLRPSTTPVRTPITPAQRAEQRLRLARLYIANNLRAKAREILADMIAKYPKTPAAAEARKLLNNLSNANERWKRPVTRSSP